MIKNLTLIFLFLTMSCLKVFAEELDIIQMESRLENRLTQILKTADPTGQVIVKVILSNEKYNLPGVSSEDVDITDVGKFKKIHLEDVVEFKIIVLSSTDSIPSWLKEQLETAVNYNRVKKSISYRKVIDPVPDYQSQKFQNMFTQWLDVYEKISNKSIWGVVAGLLGIVIGLFSLIAGVVYAIRRAVREHIVGLQSMTENMNYGARSKSPTVNEVSSSNIQRAQNSVSSVQGFSGANELSGITDQALLSIFSDCYWSTEDQYANWIWQNINERQRAFLLEKFPYAYEYASYIYNQEMKKMMYHQHPAYSMTVDFSRVSNSDLKTIVVQKKELWKRITPIRQNSLGFGIKERLEFDLQDNASVDKGKFHQDLNVNSKPRSLVSEWGKIDISSEDEVFLLNNYKLIATKKRHSIYSLVWLSLLEKEIQKTILAQYSAEDLAMAWIGSPEVMSEVSTSVPEKKRVIIEEFCKTIKPSRDSWVMKQICTQAIEYLDDEKDELSKNSHAA